MPNFMHFQQVLPLHVFWTYTVLFTHCLPLFGRAIFSVYTAPSRSIYILTKAFVSWPLWIFKSQWIDIGIKWNWPNYLGSYCYNWCHNQDNILGLTMTNVKLMTRTLNNEINSGRTPAERIWGSMVAERSD